MKLTIEYLESLAVPLSFERGEKYYREGKVRGLMQTPEGLEAEVAGSQLYRQYIALQESVWKGTCSCPYDGEGICKHLVAVGLAFLNKYQAEGIEDSQNRSFKVDPGWISQRLIGMARDELVSELDGYKGQITSKEGPEYLMDVLRILTGTYEGIFPAYQLDESVMAHFEQLKAAFISICASAEISIPVTKEGINWIFRRWTKYESVYNGASSNLPRYNLYQWQDVFNTLIKESIGAHFVEMKLQAYGLTESDLPSVYAHIRKISS